MSMTVGGRLTVSGLVVAAIVVGIGITLVPVRVTFGAGSLRCGTALDPDRTGEIADVCGPAATDQLGEALRLGAVLALLAILPLVIDRLKPHRRKGAWGLWGVVFTLVALAGIGVLSYATSVGPHRVFDL